MVNRKQTHEKSGLILQCLCIVGNCPKSASFWLNWFVCCWTPHYSMKDWIDKQTKWRKPARSRNLWHWSWYNLCRKFWIGWISNPQCHVQYICIFIMQPNVCLLHRAFVVFRPLQIYGPMRHEAYTYCLTSGIIYRNKQFVILFFSNC